MTPDNNADAAISFVEKLLVLLDEGRKTATYKFAVLLAAAPHVTHWSLRLEEPTGSHLRQLAAEHRWASHVDTSRSVARAIYLRRPDDAKLWMRKNEFATFDRAPVEVALGAAPRFGIAAEDSPPFRPGL